MENISLIAAIGKNGELGKDNTLIWHLKEDLAFFKEQTMGKPIIMGMNTFKSLPRLLPGRKHIVLTSKTNPELDPSVAIVHSKPELFELVDSLDDEVFIIGGARVYAEFIEYASKMYLTEIDAEEKNADAYFPTFNQDDYEKDILSEHEDNGIKYRHVLYKKKQN